MHKYSYQVLERSLAEINDGRTETESIPVGTAVPTRDFDGMFYKSAADLWQLDPNVQIESDSYWKLSEDNKYFVKVYDGNAEPHDHRWTVYPNSDKTKISVAYKDEAITSVPMSVLGVDSSDVRSAQISMLKLLNTKSGRESLLDTLDDKSRRIIYDKYPELK